MHYWSKIPMGLTAYGNLNSNLTWRNTSIDPLFNTKVEDWLFKHFQTMEQIKEYSEIQKEFDKENYSDLMSGCDEEYSEIQKKFDKESYSDLMFVCDEDVTKQNTMTNSNSKVNRWLKNNFTTINEIKRNVKEHQRRSNTHFVADLFNRINISKAKVLTVKRIKKSLNKRIAKWMNFVPTDEIEEFETENGGLLVGSTEKEDRNVYDSAKKDNHESISEVNSTILRLVDDLDYLGSASQHGNDINISSDHSLLSFVSQKSHLSCLTSYSSSDTSDLDLVFYENVEFYSKWLVKKKRNIRDPIIIYKSKSTAV